MKTTPTQLVAHPGAIIAPLRPPVTEASRSCDTHWTVNDPPSWWDYLHSLKSLLICYDIADDPEDRTAIHRQIHAELVSLRSLARNDDQRAESAEMDGRARAKLGADFIATPDQTVTSPVRQAAGPEAMDPPSLSSKSQLSTALEKLRWQLKRWAPAPEAGFGCRELRQVA